MRFSRPRAGNAALGALPLTSLIDVVFLLLIYFLFSSSFSVPESNLSAAIRTERRGSGQAGDLTPQIVHVLVQNGTEVFRVGDRLLTEQRALTDLLKQLPKERGVFVKVSAQASVGAAAAAVQATKDAGFTRVTYVPAK